MSVFKVGSNKSSQNNFPSVRPTLDLDFANSKTLDPRITFTRASGGSYVGADGLIKLAGVNEPRFDHDLVTGESLGLLVEEARTNLLYSSAYPPQQNGLRMTYTTGPSLARPDGTVGTVNQLTTDTFGSVSFIRFTNSVFGGVANTVYTGSMWIRTATGSSDINIKVNDANLSYGGGAFFNATTSWKRISVAGVDVSQNLLILDLTTSSTLPAGTTFYIWGAQIEAGSFPTSYIPTEGSTRTRAADVASIGSSATWFNPSGFTIVSDCQGSPATTTTTNTGTGYPYIFSFSSDISNRLVGARSAGGADNGQWALYSNPPGSFAFNSNANFNSTRRHKVGGAYNSTSYQSFADGVIGSSLTPGANTSILNSFQIGAGVDGGFWGGTIARLTYYPKRLTDAQLQVLTR